MLQARRNEIEQMALKVAWWCDIMAERLVDMGEEWGQGGHPPLGNFKNLDTF